MNADILDFIEEQTCVTISCIDSNTKPYCFTAFYAWDDDNDTLIYKSSPETNHSQILSQSSLVAGTIHPDHLHKDLVQGIQFEGEVLKSDEAATERASDIYHEKHHTAIGHPGEIWVIQVNHIKMTDSTKGFGTKLEWKR